MSSADERARERLRQLMMAALDEEIDGAERRELDQALDADAELQAEWERLRRLKEVTETMELRKPPEEIWQRYWVSIYNRVERGVGWILVSIGAIVLLSFAAWQMVAELFSDSEAPLYIRLALLALCSGVVVLFVSVLREKLFTGSRDPYKEVER